MLKKLEALLRKAAEEGHITQAKVDTIIKHHRAFAENLKREHRDFTQSGESAINQPITDKPDTNPSLMI